MAEPQGTKEGQYMHESISEDAVKYDMDSEQIISALCQDNETLQAENKKLAKDIFVNEKKLIDMEAENKRLKEALSEYGSHKRDCDIDIPKTAFYNSGKICSCGYQQVLDN